MLMLSLLLVAGLVATSISAAITADPELSRIECSEGWELIDRTCFLLANDSGTWETGQAFCNQRGANLATISSQTQQDAITAMLSQSVWIGLNDRKVEGDFAWADGSEYSYTSWDDGEPNNEYNIEDCVEMRQIVDYKWNDKLCNTTFHFLCSMPPKLITTTATPLPVCEEGWEMFEDAMCYKVSDGVASWPRARDACLAQYAQLAAVTSKGQQNFLAARLTGDTWIGLNDEMKEGTFTWQDGTEPGYTNWYEREPCNNIGFAPNGEGEDCVEMKHQYDYMWNDHMCHIQKQFVCQKPPSKTC